jgi:spermidine synthase
MKSKTLILGTAFFEGLAVLIVEIAGARALAPFFGSSLQVWTAQITATLLFLALGYRLGAYLSLRSSSLQLPALFWLSGLWLALFPLLRAPVLGSFFHAGVQLGSFFSASLLFGPVLLCLGSVSPVLIGRLEVLEPGAGKASGRLFFINTLGGLVGGWLTALLIIPSFPLSLSLAGLGGLLALLGAFWAMKLGRSLFSSGAPVLLALFFFSMAPDPARSLRLGRVPASIVESRESSVGLIQVMEMGGRARALLIDGITQGGMELKSQASLYEFTAYQDFLSHRYHPQAKSALLLGLGSGVLARLLDERGLKVSAAELEPRIAEVARRWFALPDSVNVIPQDARAYLRQSSQTYDLIFLDAFAGECPPWYLSTREALDSMKAHLNPGGRLLINSVAWNSGDSPGLARLEAALMQSFGEAKVFCEKPDADHELINAIVVAGKDLKASAEPFKGRAMEAMRPKIEAIAAQERLARSSGMMDRDDFSDLDYAEGPLRAVWRRLVLESLGPELLGS